MAKPEFSIEHKNAEFAALAVKSLQEAVRRALIGHDQRGHLVPAWRAVNVEWVAPEEILSQYPAQGQDGAAADAERLRLDCASGASHNLNRLLDKPGKTR